MSTDEEAGPKTARTENGEVEPVVGSGDAAAAGAQTAAKKKNKKSKKKSAGAAQQQQHSSTATALDGADAAPETSSAEFRLRQTLEALSLSTGGLGSASTAPKDMDEAKKKHYAFWDTQPVPKIDETVTTNEAIEPDRPQSDLRQEPYSLPDGFYWSAVELTDEKQLKELYLLLNENYVEDDDNMFRFDYSSEFLKWALMPPGWVGEWHCGVRANKTGKLLAFIGAIPSTIRISDKVQKMVEINFLCVHKKMRTKRVAPVLIREITRRVNLRGIFQAVYTAGIIIPKPITTCRYWHRSLNPKKLIEVKFSHLSRNMTMQRMLKLYRLPAAPKTPGFRVMTEADIPAAFRLLTEYLRRFDVAPVFSVHEFQHFFMPRLDVIDCFVVEREGEVTDFVSYYTLPSSVMHHPQYKEIKAAYAFYNVAAPGTHWTDLINDALITARNNNYDVFNALDVMDNKKFLEPLKFGIGDGNLQYYFYNWRCPEAPPEMIGLVLQ